MVGGSLVSPPASLLLLSLSLSIYSIPILVLFPFNWKFPPSSFPLSWVWFSQSYLCAQTLPSAGDQLFGLGEIHRSVTILSSFKCSLDVLMLLSVLEVRETSSVSSDYPAGTNWPLLGG